MKQGNIKQQRRRKQTRKYKLGAAAFVLLFIAAAVLIVWKVFTVKNVVVEGNELYSDEVIEQTILKDEYAWNSLYVLLKYNFAKKENVPFIDTMEVSLTGPHTVKVVVYEKGTLGCLYIKDTEEYAYFDKDGIVVEQSPNLIDDVPIIQGVVCEKVQLYHELPLKDAELFDMLTLTQTLKRNGIIPDAVIYGDINSPILVYNTVRVPVGDESTLTQKVERLTKILPELEGKSGVLHLETWTEEKTDIVFKLD